MNRRTMLATLATAALIPSARLLANSKFPLPSCPPGHGGADRHLTRTLTALERAAWEAGKDFDVEAADALYSKDFYEIVMGGWLVTRQELLDTIEARTFVINSYEFSEVQVFRMTETSALFRYRILVDYIWDGDPGVSDLRVTSSYALLRGRWKCCSYQETPVDA